MKNIHILPTDNSSRLGIYNGTLTLHRQGWRNGTQHIYITSDEYIGLSYYLDGNLVRKGVVDDKDYWEVRKDYKKIILTTDQDLINDGIQVIDDEFLEWFVKNPSCDEVKVEDYGNIYNFRYLILIPKEEPKQELEKEMFELEQELDIPSHLRWHNSKPKLETIKEGGKINPLLMDEIGQFKFLPKQETTSEGFHRISKEFDYSEFDFVSFKIGTEWQQEQFSKSEFIQLVRATKSDAEARRIIREYFK